jgi:hypothetical protein
MTKDAEDYVRARFAEAVIGTDPFPHFILRDVLPAPIFEAMERSLPPRWRWTLSAMGETFKKSKLQGILYQFYMRSLAAQPTFSVRHPDTAYDYSLAPYRNYWKEQFGPILELIDALTTDAFSSHIASYRDRMRSSGVAIGEHVTLGRHYFADAARNGESIATHMPCRKSFSR